jgi:hypothetical protein
MKKPRVHVPKVRAEPMPKGKPAIVAPGKQSAPMKVAEKVIKKGQSI